MQQLTLGLALRQDATFANFSPGSNDTLINLLKSSLHGVGERFYFLWGAPGLGASHLLHACCHEAGRLALPAVFLDMQQHADLSPGILEGLETVSVLCLDNISAIAGLPDWEEGLFHLYNRARANAHTCFIVADHNPPMQLPLHLPDLRSRLAWGLVYELQALSDPEKLALLQVKAKQRGLDLSEDVGHFILQRCNRDFPSLLHTLAQLDKASLVEQRRLTIPFVKRILGI
jgi:DnaA family protein